MIRGYCHHHKTSFETVAQLNRHAKNRGCLTSYCASSEGSLADAEFSLDDAYAEELEKWMLVMIENTLQGWLRKGWRCTSAHLVSGALYQWTI